MLVCADRFGQTLGKHVTVRKNIRSVHVRAISACAAEGVLIAGTLRIPCALGRSGVTSLKREGDGATPRGRLKLRALLHRPDQILRIRSAVATRPLRPAEGWCEVPGDRNYNRPVAIPYAASHERMWRDDRLYDIVGLLDWNERPRRGNAGSAIFFHIRRGDGGPTAGCIAISLKDMRRLLPLLARKPVFIVR
jgi:L,D-peptidoglycan transpeptidase YkuD (ErfK/YbiS/YcfS/YnhG family)